MYRHARTTQALLSPATMGHSQSGRFGQFWIRKRAEEGRKGAEGW